MSFVYPGFLFALAALAIPVIIHLFHFRRFRTVYFSNVRFLKEVKEETASRSNLKHLLVLLARLLAITFLVFAFAQPFLPEKDTKVVEGTRSVSVYIDNSFSMDAIGDQVALLEKAREKAREIVSGYGAGDQFQLLTNDFEGRHQQLLDRQLFDSYVDEVNISPNVKSLQQVVDRQLQALEGADNPTLYLISDFQQPIDDLEIEDTNANVILVPLQAVAQRNISIDSLWLDAPVQILNETALVFVKLTNHGEEPVETANITLTLDGERKAIGDFSIQGTQTIVDTLRFTIAKMGWQAGKVSITDYPITFDDNYYFSFYTPESIEILALNQDRPSPFITGLASQGYLRISNSKASQVNYGDIDKYRLIILNQVDEVASGLASTLKTYVENGGNLLVFPSPDMNLESYRSFLQQMGAGGYEPLANKPQTIASVDVKQGLFSDVFENLPENMQWPSVQKYYPITQLTRTREEVIIRLKDGSPFLSKYDFANGAVYLCAVPPATEFSELPRHTLFAVMVFQMAITGNTADPVAYTIGQDNTIAVEQGDLGSDENYKLRLLDKPEVDFFPAQQLLGTHRVLNLAQAAGTPGQLQEDGVYVLYAPGQTGPVKYLAFNYDRAESDIHQVDIGALEEAAPKAHFSVIEDAERNLSSVVGAINKGTTLWKLCIILALVFLGIEVLLLRLLPD